MHYVCVEVIQNECFQEKIISCGKDPRLTVLLNVSDVACHMNVTCVEFEVFVVVSTPWKPMREIPPFTTERHDKS